MAIRRIDPPADVADDAQLRTQAIGKRRLSARTGACDKDNACAVCRNAVGNLRNRALLHGFADTDE